MTQTHPSSQARLRVVADDATVSGRVDEARAVERPRIEQALLGDGAAWEVLYRSHYRELLRFCSYSTGSVEAGEDATQEVFARALANLGQFDGRALFSTWLRGIAMNLVRKQWRKGERQGRAYAKVSSAPQRSRQPDELLVRDRRADALDDALRALPAKLREAFVLCDVQGLSASEAGAITGASPGNVRVRATRARARLHELLSRAGVLDGDGGDP